MTNLETREKVEITSTHRVRQEQFEIASEEGADG
jgi:hypothetical protein